MFLRRLAVTRGAFFLDRHQSSPASRLIVLLRLSPQLQFGRIAYSSGCAVSQSFQKHTPAAPAPSSLTSPLAAEAKYHEIADETLEELSDLLAPLESAIDDFDLTVAQGVLTIKLGPQFQNKTWVINKQTPNRQIWWSSPVSGPRRYEYHIREGSRSVAQRWLFTKDEKLSLQDSLKSEIEATTSIQL